MLEVCKMTMTPSLSAEHQRKWDESRWECKLDDPERNYEIVVRISTLRYEREERLPQLTKQSALRKRLMFA